MRLRFEVALPFLGAKTEKLPDVDDCRALKNASYSIFDGLYSI